jgi:hypothetical protein
MALTFNPVQTNLPTPPSFAGAPMGAPVNPNSLSTLGELTNIQSTRQGIATSEQALAKAQATYGYDVSKAESEAKQKATEAQNAALDYQNKEYNAFQTVISPHASDASVLAASKLTPQSTPEEVKKVQEGLLNLGESTVKELMNRGVSKIRAYQLVAPHFAETMTDPKIAAQNINLAVQKLAGSANIAEQNQPRFEKNAAGEFVQVTPARNQVAPVGGGANANPTSGGVSSTTDYIKDLQGRVATGINMDIKLNEAEQLLGQFKAGAGTKAYQDFAQRLQAIGAPQDLVDKVSGGDLSAVQSVNKFIAQAVTQGASQAGGNGTTANILNEYVKNNPDVNNDPRALKRFIEFAKKQNELAYKENEFLLGQKQTGKFNPETHIQEMQQHLRKEYLTPKEKKESAQVNKNEPAISTRKVVRTGKDSAGRNVVQYDDGTIGYK